MSEPVYRCAFAVRQHFSRKEINLTPLSKWALASWITVLVGPLLAVVLLCILASKGAPIAGLFGLGAFFVVLEGYTVFVAINLNRGDTTLGNIFKKCPCCVGAQVIYDIKITFQSHRVLCPNCNSKWHFKIHPLWGSLDRLSLVNRGKVIDDKALCAVRKTDDPKAWEQGASDRFSS